MRAYLLAAGLTLAAVAHGLPPICHGDFTPYDLRATPAPVLRGFAMAESDEIDAAVGDDGISVGRFQLNSKFFGYYRWRWGDFDPRDPWDAARITDVLFQSNYDELLSTLSIIDPSQWDDLRMTLAIAAHRQGVAGVRKDGPSMWYVNKVRAFAREGMR